MDVARNGTAAVAEPAPGERPGTEGRERRTQSMRRPFAGAATERREGEVRKVLKKATNADRTGDRPRRPGVGAERRSAAKKRENATRKGDRRQDADKTVKVHDARPTRRERGGS